MSPACVINIHHNYTTWDARWDINGKNPCLSFFLFFFFFKISGGTKMLGILLCKVPDLSYLRLTLRSRVENIGQGVVRRVRESYCHVLRECHVCVT